MEIKISFTGESLYDIEVQMQMFLANVGTMRDATDAVPGEEKAEDPVPEAEPEKPKAQRKRTTTLKKPKPAPEKEEKSIEEEVQDQETLAIAAGAHDEVEEETEEDPNPGKKAFDASETRRKAISKLMILYNEGGDVQKSVKELLKAFDVKKFSEVPDEKVDDLIKAADRIEAKKKAAA